MTSTRDDELAGHERESREGGEGDAVKEHADRGVSTPVENDSPEHDDMTPERAFTRTIEEGRRRMGRRLPAMVATGVVGGIDVGTGVLALLLVEEMTGSKLLGGLAFGIGFVALLLASSDLFTEDFLVPVTAVIARKSTIWRLIRLWVVTMAANLFGGWVLTGLVMAGFPSLRAKAVELGTFYVDLGFGWRSFALALLGGLVITLMTWLQHSTESVGGQMAAAIGGAFLLGAGALNHAIVASLLMFAALHTGDASFGYLQWAETMAFASLGNIVGGVGLVTVLRLLQVPDRVMLERSHPEV